MKTFLFTWKDGSRTIAEGDNQLEAFKSCGDDIVNLLNDVDSWEEVSGIHIVEEQVLNQED